MVISSLPQLRRKNKRSSERLRVRWSVFMPPRLLHLLTPGLTSALSKYPESNSRKENNKMKRIFLSALIVISLAAGVIAQGRRGAGPGGAPPAFGDGQRREPAAALKEALNLTDAQVTAIQSLMSTRRERATALRSEIEQKRQTLNAALDAANPIPSDVGNAAISLRASEKKMGAERDWFIDELKKLLTGDQQAKLDTLIAAGTPIPGLGPGSGGPGGPGPRGRGRPPQ
jgi:Spy/CpxP family protein refolding chaperone